jgi:hypothetical protein
MQTTHLLFESLERLSAQVVFSVTSAQRLVEVSWNTTDLRLPITASALFRCDDTRSSEGAEHNTHTSSLPPPAARGTLSVEPSSAAHEHRYSVTFAECPRLIAELFGVPVEALTPRAAWRFVQEICWARLGEREGQVVIERDVEYLHPEVGVVLAKEAEVRLEVREGEAPKALREALSALPHLPVVTKYWMAEYHYKRLLRWPTHNDLPGYEYEAKLSVNHLDVYDLPKELEGRFQVIERYQTESVRWYFESLDLPDVGHLEKGRVGFRGSRASLVSKGKKQKLAGGVLKRTEEKSQGLDTWRLSALEPLALEMRRIKRQIYVLNRHNRRVYAICLDHCEAETRQDPFIQLEIEYNGLLQIKPEEWGLSFEAQWRLARALEQRAPRAALRCCERAALFLPAVSAPEEGVSEALTALTQRLRVEALTPLVSGEVDPTVEAQVVSEMNELSAALQRAYGFTPSEQTKRQWLAQPLPSPLTPQDPTEAHRAGQ